MGLFDWFRKRSARKVASGPLGDQGKFYYLLNYREEYEELLSWLPEDNSALPELFLFRFWLTQCTYRLCKPNALSEDEMLEDIIPNGLTLGLGIFQRLNHVDVADALGGEISELMEDRFHAYDAVFISEKTTSDQFALRAVSETLANYIFNDPDDESIDYLSSKAKSQFAEMLKLWVASREKNGASSVSPTRTESLQPSSAWMLVNEFGESKTFIDSSTVRFDGSLASAQVRYDLRPSGKDNRNNKPVKQMFMQEEYELKQGMFRVHRIDFVYDDGTRSDPMPTTPKWVNATSGNAKTLAALRRLAND